MKSIQSRFIVYWITPLSNFLMVKDESKWKGCLQTGWEIEVSVIGEKKNISLWYFALNGGESYKISVFFHRCKDVVWSVFELQLKLYKMLNNCITNKLLISNGFLALWQKEWSEKLVGKGSDEELRNKSHRKNNYISSILMVITELLKAKVSSASIASHSWANLHLKESFMPAPGALLSDLSGSCVIDCLMQSMWMNAIEPIEHDWDSNWIGMEELFELGITWFARGSS